MLDKLRRAPGVCLSVILLVTIDGTPVHELGCRDPQDDPAGLRKVLSYLRDGIRADVEIKTEVMIP